jgi:hypothetical protein
MEDDSGDFEDSDDSGSSEDETGMASDEAGGVSEYAEMAEVESSQLARNSASAVNVVDVNAKMLCLKAIFPPF